MHETSAADVELITKNKKAKTVRSGVPGAVATGPEASVRELLTASQWWAPAIDEFVRTAAQTRLKWPQLKEDYEILFSPAFKVNQEWLTELLQKLPFYRENLRKECVVDFEAKAFTHVSSTTDKVLAIKTVAEANSLGFSPLLEPLEQVLDMYGRFGTYKVVPEMKELLSKWYSGLQAEFAVQTFKEEISTVAADTAVSWDGLSKSWRKMEGAEFPNNLVAILTGKLSYLFQDLKTKAWHRAAKRFSHRTAAISFSGLNS